jgi:hypothetical protein
MLYLRQSTASQSVLIGPFVDTDGAAVTGLTIDAADIRLSKNGANIVGKNSGGGTHDELGMYTITLDATDTDTVGRLQLTVAETGALTVYHEFQVLEEAIFDGLFAASAARIPADVTAISGDTTAADNLETAFDDTAGAVPWQGIIDQGTAQSATGTTLVLRSAAAFADDELIGATIVITGGSAGVGQRRLITDYVSSTDTATVDTWTTTPTGTITYKIYATAPSSGGSGPSAAEIADAVWDESTTGHTTSGTFGEQLKTDVDAILVDTGTTLDGNITAILADTNELQTDWANGGRLDLILDARASQTTADAIETDTQNIQSRIPASLNNGCIAADVQRINDVEVVGAGTEGDKWRA